MDQEGQKRAIIDKVAGAPAGTLPQDYDLDDPWRTIYRRVKRAKSPNDAFNRIVFAVEDLEDAHSLAEQLLDLLPEDDEAFTAYPSLHEMSDDFPPVDWLWPSWVPTGVVTFLAAAPGAGKSLVALDLARRVIHGDVFPDGAPVPDPGRNVLIIDAEGAPALILQRARAWDVDLRRLFLMLPPDPYHPRSRTTEGSATDRRSARFAIELAQEEQRNRLIDMVRGLRPALIVVDSLAAATATGETSIQGARDLLGFLSMIAREARLALLVIHHLRKRARSGAFAPAPHVAADDLRGSSHLSAAARSVLALTPLGSQPAPGQPGSSSTEGTATNRRFAAVPPTLVGKVVQPAPGRPGSPESTNPESTDHQSTNPPTYQPTPLLRLEVLKTNLCRLPPPLALTLEGESDKVPTLHYTEYTEPPPSPTQIDLCAGWLLQYLIAAGAPVKPADVVQAATSEGFSQRTLYRARRVLGDTVVDLGNSLHDPRKHWTLAVEPPGPPEAPPDEAPPVQQAPLPRAAPPAEGAPPDSGTPAQ